ncbi:DMP19 family protein [Phytoactinopolyspora mesophila]|uniref:DMP19 family protein n=1 Tax=Phytoactinopolyspora mesophila TaxID=2650750 RepID=UPI0013919F51
MVDVVFEEKRILLVLEDGRRLAAPIGWAGPVVAAMDETERAGWVRTDNGTGVNWPAAGQASSDGALDVWALEEDGLYEEALSELKAAEWDVSALSTRSRSLVALWRLIADGNNGGLLQVLGNWGVGEIHAGLAALASIEAARTLAVVREFWKIVGPIAESEGVNTMNDVYTAITGADLSPRLDEFDEAFWDAAPELTRLVPLHFGPAPSAV